MNEALVLCELVVGAVEVGRGAVSLSQHPALHRLHVHRPAAEKRSNLKRKKSLEETSSAEQPPTPFTTIPQGYSHLSLARELFRPATRHVVLFHITCFPEKAKERRSRRSSRVKEARRWRKWRIRCQGCQQDKRERPIDLGE